MELNYDWQSFQDVFSRRRPTGPAAAQPTGPVYVVTEAGNVVTVYAENEDLSDWIGARIDDLATGLGHREILKYDRAKVDGWLGTSLALPHAHDQRLRLRECARPDHKAPAVSHGHFVLDAIHSWWSKLLPSGYGIFIRLEGRPESPGESAGSLLVVVRRGRIESFQEPDLSSLGAERSRQPAEIVKYLAAKHLVRVQGLFVPAHEWREWSESDRPWPLLASAVRANRARLVPFRWGLVTLMATRAFFRF